MLLYSRPAIRIYEGGGCEKAVSIFKLGQLSSILIRMEVLYVFAAALDLSRAYDRLNQCQIILQLMDFRVTADGMTLF